ncbi:hypothetical protein ASPCADRAFT_125706 [Aspergillus carbonarius ITEM 5010]|uniref:Uncharacterized protein n=1 Tax=Aspergillus carbonarius (strain ITEM 5010) TaxID=602072 RepID=A0A1R3S1Q5_ASPC5|nr:hypothetical protein ASPCADRAFT_125706 [Aspergillus carbonarius ITEM 5010]
MAAKDKRRVYIILHQRGALSFGVNRRRLGYAAYHWGIIAPPKESTGRDCYLFDVFDGHMIDPATNIDRNPSLVWKRRSRSNINPNLSGSLVAQIMIGKVPNDVTFQQMDASLNTLPVPRKGILPEENCVTWIRLAIGKLQEEGWAEQFDIDRFLDFSLAYADGRTGYESKRIFNYTARPMKPNLWWVLSRVMKRRLSELLG